MNNQEKLCILERILIESRKIYLCPLCHIPYSDAKNLLNHCRLKGQQDPKDLLHKNIGEVNTKGGFGGFLSSLGIAIGWQDIAVENLPLRLDKPGRREYGACLKFQFIIDGKTRSDPLNTDKRLTIMKDIAMKAAIHYACPSCLKGFATSDAVFNHCEEEKDENHKGLLSKAQSDFLDFYEKAMGQSIGCDTAKIIYDESGSPLFGECFRLGEILEYKREKLSPLSIRLFF
ncbi:hypothetical protein VI817_007852 [Penicillium citrinum]|nr:hypothetical protein VI817_007852 [Penicillium citrinum]